jgi:hypothetical protein
MSAALVIALSFAGACVLLFFAATFIRSGVIRLLSAKGGET